jgi:molybdate transport system substrate-binding protein
MIARRSIAVAIGVLLLALPSCGGDDSSSDKAGRLRVSGASSLKAAFTEYGRDFRAAPVSFSFAGSDELAAQIRQGARPDVFAAANAELPGQLFAEELVERPKTFASNRLVVAVPASSSSVRTIDDLAQHGVRLGIGSAGVPIGSYTRKLLSRLGGGESKAILANVRSNEPDVSGIVGKLAQGAVDAGFVYVTDVVAARPRLRAVELPRRLQPRVAYAAAVVRGSPEPATAKAFVHGLLSGDGARALRAAGFAPPPG